VLIVVTGLTAAGLLQHRLSTPTPSAVSDAALEGMSVLLDGVRLEQAPRLVLVLSATCRYCDESGDTLSRVALAARRVRLPVVVVTTDQEPAIRAFLTKIGVQPTLIHHQTRPEELRVRGTPTTLVVNASGRVARAWTGKLTADGEADVLSTLARMGNP